MQTTDDHLAGTKFISSSVTVYSVTDGVLVPGPSESEFLAFFSRDFLQARGWSVFPLWEGDLRSLRLDDDSTIEPLTQFSEHWVAQGHRILHTTTIERSEWPYDEKAIAVTIVDRQLDLKNESPSSIFEVQEDRMPYWGHNFIWTGLQDAFFYTNGDNASFVAGQRHLIEKKTGLSYEYCVQRFIAANANHQGWAPLVRPFISFCDEFRCD